MTTTKTGEGGARTGRASAVTARGAEILRVIARKGCFFATTPGSLSAVRALEATGAVRSKRVMVGTSGLSTLHVVAS